MAKYQQYEEYKNSGIEWLGKIPSHWVVQPLKHQLIFMKNGSTSTQIDETKETAPISRIETISSGEIDMSRVGFIDIKTIPKTFELDKGDILFSHINSLSMIGNLAIKRNNDKLFHGMNLLRLKLDSSKCVVDYMFWLLKSKNLRQVIEANAKPAINQASISTQSLKNIYLNIPTEKEQTQIANFLDHETAQIDTLIDKQQTLIQLLKEKRQAVISHAVTKGLNPDAPMKNSGVEWLGEVPEHWEVWKFQHIAPIITCGIASTPTYVDEDEGMPFLSAQNIRDNKLSLHKYNYIPYQLHEQLTKYRKPEMGDLLVTRVGAGIGDACVIDIEMEFSIYVSLTHIRVDPLIGLNKFVMYFFGSDYCKYLNYQGTVTGGGVGNLNVGNLERYKIPLPDLVEQTNIVHYLETESAKFDNLIRKSEQAIQLMQERRTALISAAVTGKIDVRSWQAPDTL